MNKIGFQNFRRFQDFPPMECGPITFLVGRNNSGKSTLVKAFMLVNNYLASGNILNFPIGENILEEVNIVTYGRALHQPSGEDFIRFFSSYDEFEIEITISGNESDTMVFVRQLLIRDTKNHIEYDYNWKTLRVKKNVISGHSKKDSGELLNKVEQEIKKQESMLAEMASKKSSRDYLELTDSLNQLREKRNILAHEIAGKVAQLFKGEYSIDIEIDFADTFDDLLDFFISTAVNTYKRGFDEVSNNAEAPENFESYRAFYEDQPIFEASIERFIEVTSNIKFVYLSANSSKQSALLSIRDKKNELAQSIHQHYTGLNDQTGFIKKWMQEFEVGEDYEIKLHAGEAYEVKIRTDNEWIQLADLGLGSIQAIQLIFRVANILDNDIYENASDGKKQLKTIFIEEPELNLHPALQSKLADLFFEAFDKHQIRFIIETHSEYVLRRSQVIVAENDLQVAPNENPFCVFYFPKEKGQLPYRMNYDSNGIFDKNFGEGFFDAASISTLELLKLKRQKLA